MRPTIAVLATLALAGCAGGYGAPPLVSAQSPPASASAASEPQLASSLPNGAANLSPAPGALTPNLATIPLRAF